MRIAWDCRSIAPFMGGIGHATAAWINEFIRQKPRHWEIHTIFSSVCKLDDIHKIVPNLNGNAEVLHADAGFIDAKFEQLALPIILQHMNADLYFNPCFSIPAIRTTRFQASVVHDIVFFEHPEWVDANLCRHLAHGTDLALRRADLVLTVSEYSLNKINALSKERNWNPDQKRGIIRPAIADSFAKIARTPRHTEQRDEHGFIFYLGAIELKKGIVVLLDAYVILRTRLGNKCPKLILVGGNGGMAFDLKSNLTERKLTNDVQYLGSVSEAEKIKLLTTARLFIFPSYYEGFGIPPLEAMACGTPVVAARSSSLPEVLGDAASYFKPGDAHGLAESVVKLLSDTVLRGDLIRKGRTRSVRHTSVSEVQTLIRLFKEIVCSK